MFARLSDSVRSSAIAFSIGIVVCFITAEPAAAETSVHRLGRKMEKLKTRSQQALKDARLILGDAVDHSVPQIINVNDDDLCEELFGGAIGIKGHREKAGSSNAGSKSSGGHSEGGGHPRKDQ